MILRFHQMVKEATEIINRNYYQCNKSFQSYEPSEGHL